MASIFKLRLSGKTKWKLFRSASVILAEAACESLTKDKKRLLITSCIVGGVIVGASLLFYQSRD